MLASMITHTSITDFLGMTIPRFIKTLEAIESVLKKRREQQ